MTLTLLLDLDDTLLDSNMNTFIPAYFQALSGFLAEQVQPDLMLPALIAGTRKMMANTDPSRTLQQVFDAEFFPKIGLPRESLQPRIDRFYDQVFPSLSHLTQPRPAAVELVEWALAQGYRLGIATNPLFPLKAVQHRMTWAGLPPEQYPFEVISSYETFHFTKPNPAYLAEMLGSMGWPDGPVLAVGDDIELDLPAAHGLGLPAWWISAPEAISPDGYELAGRGSIADLRPWLEARDLSTLEPAFSTPSALAALMLSTPAILSGLAGQARGPVMKRRPEPAEWSLAEILCHLRDTEQEVYQPRLRLLLEQDEPFIPARNTDEWAEQRGYRDQDGLQALQDFIAARLQTLEIMRGLGGADWQRKARHAIFGPTHLGELVRFMAEHDRLHIRQAQTTLLYAAR
ncbi:MAG: DinB family protein [Chloroflexota bacterium]